MSDTAQKILAIDTATEACSVALYLDGTVTQKLQVERNGHSRLVLDMAESLLRDAGVALAELDALAVDVGPGSFTGLRIGIGVAQGLAYGAGLRVLPVGSLATLAGDVNVDDDTKILAAIDARMKQIYFALYARKNNVPNEIISPSLIATEALTFREHKKIIGVGNAWDRFSPTMLQGLNDTQINWLPNRHPEAATVAKIAAAQDIKNAVSPLELTAAYIRDKVAVPSG